jgi:hypothetical protein
MRAWAWLGCMVLLGACGRSGDSESECTGGDLRCKEEVLEICDGGSWKTSYDCGDNGQICSTSGNGPHCTSPSCYEGHTQCAANSVQVCVNRRWVKDIDCNATSQYCRETGGDASCVANPCDVTSVTPESDFGYGQVDLVLQPGEQLLWAFDGVEPYAVWIENWLFIEDTGGNRTNFPGKQPGTTGTITIDATQRSYDTCGVCVFAGKIAGFSQDGNFVFEHQLMATSGTVDYQAFGTEHGDAFHVVLNNMVFREVDPDNYDDVPGGQRWCLASVDIDETVEAFSCGDIDPGFTFCPDDIHETVCTPVVDGAGNPYTGALSASCGGGQTCFDETDVTSVEPAFEGECTDECTGGVSRCSALGNVQECADAHYVTTNQCSLAAAPSACFEPGGAAACYETCGSAGATRCLGDVIQTCTGAYWDDSVDCTATSQTCQEGAPASCVD